MVNSDKVYLDHLVKRENLRYKRSEEEIDVDTSGSPVSNNLRLSDLVKGTNVRRLLRKPDFQRATYAWSPEACVSLLDSVINEQVIPSIIMWTSPESGYDFILDGGHRVSVIMAWLDDDWGESKIKNLDIIIDEEEIKSIRLSADKVRKLVNAKIGNVQTYIDAEKAIEKITDEGQYNAKQKLGDELFNKGKFYMNLLKGYIGFHRLWVKGNYEKAEASFLKINRSGQMLDNWETKLIENRNSSFARTIMSVANVNSASHYWPSPSSIADSEEVMDLSNKVKNIKEKVESLHIDLFKPYFNRQIFSVTLPLFVAERQNRPHYLAELLTVLEGGKGNSASTEELLRKGMNNSPNQIILKGDALVNSLSESISHLIGKSNDPKSLGIVPALYFYTEKGKYVRSLLYGFIYWMLTGSEKTILNRKRSFCAQRERFEKLLFLRKDNFVAGLTRKSGSGSDITVQTAHLFDETIRLLIRNSSDIESDSFNDDFNSLLKKFYPTKRGAANLFTNKRKRSFSTSQKTNLILNTLLSSSISCGICGGLVDTQRGIQFDHKEDFAKGGLTTVENQQVTHPFCNNNKEFISRIKGNVVKNSLPNFNSSMQHHQLSLDFDGFR